METHEQQQEPCSGRVPLQRGRLQAENLRRTRSEHAREVAEDYVEAIADLVSESGEARVVDLAEAAGRDARDRQPHGVRLKRAGYVNTQPYRAIFLTDTGRHLATTCKNRHDTIVAFLCSLGIPVAVAERDARASSTT